MTVTDDNLATGRRRDGDASRARTPGANRPRSAAAEKALERRRKRLGTDGLSSTSRHWQRPESAGTQVEKQALWGRMRSAPVQAVRRVPFAVVVVGMLLAGLALTLWLSTKSAQDSYQLGVERAYNEQLSDRRDALKKTYESGDSAPELSEKASDLGMIPATDVPRMVVGVDGRETVVGEIKPAEGDKAPSMNNGPRTTAPQPRPAEPTAEAPAAPGAQGIPIQGTPITPGDDAANPLPSAPQAPAQAPAEPPSAPAYSNVLPSNGGAPGANSGEAG